MDESKIPPPSHPKNIPQSPQNIPPIVPGEPHTKFIPKKLMVLVLFASCLGIISFAVWLSGH